MSCWTAPNRWLQRGALALWSLSALYLSRQFAELVLITDNRGAAILSGGLRLPFTRVCTALQDLDAPLARLTNVWALGKLVAVAQLAATNHPFAHFDHDVLLRAPLPGRVLNAPVAFERPVRFPAETGTYANLALPAAWQAALLRGEAMQWCCGLIAGNDTAALFEWADEALFTARLNSHELVTRHGGSVSVFLEQWSAMRHFTKAETLFPGAMPVQGDEFFAHWLHLGGAAKLDREMQAKVRAALEREWPGQLAKCDALEAELLEKQEVEPLW